MTLQDFKFRLVEVRDERGFTLLHHAALKMRHEKLKLLIEYARDVQNEDEDILQDWINTKTNKEKLSALHLATFKGCLKSVYVLLQHGADKNAVNSYGLGMLHIAAQGDSPNTLYYFWKVVGMDLNKKDSRGSTPLHWACFS